MFHSVLLTAIASVVSLWIQPPPGARPPGAAASDSIVDALHALVRSASPELAAHRAAVDAAEARVAATGHAAPVAVTAETEGVPNVVDVTRAQSVRVQAEHELVPRALRSAQRDLARTDVDAARAALTLGEQRLAAVADRALLALVGWTTVAQRLASEDSLLASAESSLRARFAVGDARYVDVLRLRTERLRVASDRVAATTGAQAGGRALEGLIGDAPDSTRLALGALAGRAIASGSTLGILAIVPPAPNVDSLLATSGRLALADAALGRATAQRQRTLAEQRPRVSGFVGIQRFAADGGYPIGPVAGATISLPFTARTANAARTIAAERDVVAAVAERRATVAGLRATLLAARDRYEGARARIATFDAALLRGAQDERESALASYRSGELSLLELLDFERALARVEIERLHNRIDAADALAALLGADGSDAAMNPTSRPDVLDER